MKPRFSTLIFLTLLTAILLVPFALSSSYLPMVRDRTFELYELFRSDLYKQATGFLVLALVLLEMGLSLRKRGRKWKLKIPGSVVLWRSLHIFIGVFLVAAVLVHTVGATGFNFNAAFLWVFFAVSLSALVGVVAETGILETDIVQALRGRLFRQPQPGHSAIPRESRETIALPQEEAVAAHPSSGASAHQGVNGTYPVQNQTGNSGSPGETGSASMFTSAGVAKLPRLYAAMSKGPIIRGLRAIWLSAHILLVSIFTIMLGFHIFLAYYYQ